MSFTCKKCFSLVIGDRCTCGMIGVDLANGPDQHAEMIVQAGNLVAAPPAEWGRVVSMVEFKGVIFVACEFRVCRLVDGRLETIPWAT